MKSFLLASYVLLALAVHESVSAPVSIRKLLGMQKEKDLATNLSLGSLNINAEHESSSHSGYAYEEEAPSSPRFRTPSPFSSDVSEGETHGKGKKPQKNNADKAKGKLRQSYIRRHERKAAMGKAYREAYGEGERQAFVPPEWKGMSRGFRDKKRREWLGLPAEASIPAQFHYLHASLLKMAFEIRMEAKNFEGRLMSIEESLEIAKNLDETEDAARIHQLLHQDSTVGNYKVEKASRSKAPAVDHRASRQETGYQGGSHTGHYQYDQGSHSGHGHQSQHDYASSYPEQYQNPLGVHVPTRTRSQNIDYREYGDQRSSSIPYFQDFQLYPPHHSYQQ
ncbi:hypothetical protein CBS101457_006886 [Exobasidium rhododendri]|nr:hypothetical protein CBS101457_006886 [Exobasidium rhododendri]